MSGSNLARRPLRLALATFFAAVEAVQQFSYGEQRDDITLVVARCTA
jgi:hypothetical protein